MPTFATLVRIANMIPPTAVGVAAGVGLLRLFYITVRSAWPTYYSSFGPHDYGTVVNRGPFRYFAFTVAPVYLITLVVSTTVGRLHGHAMAGALAIGGIHLWFTQIRHIRDTMRNDKTRLGPPSILYAIAMTVLVLLFAFLAGLGPGPFPQLVPAPHEFVNTFWTTAFVALLTAYIALNAKVQRDPVQAVVRSEAEVGRDLIDQARNAATKARADENLVVAVLLTENLQRPPWFRRLERAKGRLFREGTYGVMQVRADRPISDSESIRLAVTDFLAGVQLRYHDEYNVDEESLKAALRAYNNSDNFVSLGSDVFKALQKRRAQDPARWRPVPPQRIEASQGDRQSL
jgi:hypothetical protein